MEDDVRYKVGCFTVTLKAGDTDEIQPWSHAICECEEFAEIARHPLNKTPESKTCKHIREAEMFHIYSERVSPVEE